MPLERKGDAERVPGDDEVSVYKRRVLEVAKRYAEEHSMCSVINDALEEIDLPGVCGEGAEPIFVDVALKVRMSCTVDDMELLKGTPEEQNAIVANWLKAESSFNVTIGYNPWLSQSSIRRISDVVVEDLNDQDPLGPPVGYVYRVASAEGRVQHIVSDSASHYQWNALCSTGPSDTWRQDSAVEAVCKRCLATKERAGL